MNTTTASSLFGRRSLFLVLVLGGLFLQLLDSPVEAAGKNHSGKDQAKEKPYALIFGTVYGPDNRAAYGVRIKIRRADENKAKWELTSDHRGEFAQRVPAGEADYIVWADLKVPKGAVPPEVKVHILNDERRDISLHLTQ